MDLSLLQSFCGDRSYSKNIAIYNNDNVIATDGLIAVITKNIFNIVHNQPEFEKLNEYMTAFFNEEKRQLFDISDIKELESIPCDSCNNTGFSSTCPECINGKVEWLSDNGYEYEADCEVIGCRRGIIDLTKPLNNETKEILELCSKCHGTLYVYDTTPKIYGHLKFNPALLLKLNKLNDVKLIIPYNSKYGYFTFDEGFGLICPTL